jgi:pimeloyl-ACP methyl ester carboxylesterase
VFQVVKYGVRLAWDILGARLLWIKNARHFAMLDQGDMIAAQFLAFLRG